MNSLWWVPCIVNRYPFFPSMNKLNFRVFPPAIRSSRLLPVCGIDASHHWYPMIFSQDWRSAAWESSLEKHEEICHVHTMGSVRLSYLKGGRRYLGQLTAAVATLLFAETVFTASVLATLCSASWVSIRAFLEKHVSDRYMVRGNRHIYVPPCTYRKTSCSRRSCWSCPCPCPSCPWQKRQ